MTSPRVTRKTLSKVSDELVEDRGRIFSTTAWKDDDDDDDG